MIKRLVNTPEVGMDQVVVLSPYRAQCHVIREELTALEFSRIPVISIAKSQGKPQ